jgi:hypothetical protein
MPGTRLQRRNLKELASRESGHRQEDRDAGGRNGNAPPEPQMDPGQIAAAKKMAIGASRTTSQRQGNCRKRSFGEQIP